VLQHDIEISPYHILLQIKNIYTPRLIIISLIALPRNSRGNTKYIWWVSIPRTLPNISLKRWNCR